MPRAKRRKSLTGYYHIMLKGIDDRNIFMDDQNRFVFIDCMLKSKHSGDFDVICYCHMNNHVHLLVKKGEQLESSL